MFNYNNFGVIVEIIIRESSGAKIESYKFNINDNDKTKRIMNLLRKKYGLNDFSKKDKDIGWLNKPRW